MHTATETPAAQPIHAPIGLAFFTNNAKKNRQKIGTVSRLTVLFVIAVMLPGTNFTNELAATMIAPIRNASQRVFCSRRRSASSPSTGGMKSDVTTAVIELMPESMLDIAAAKMADTTNPVTTGGN